MDIARKIDMNSERHLIRIVIADQQRSIRGSLRRALESAGDIQILADVSDASAAARLAHELKPDILLVDLGLSRQFAPRALNEMGTRSAPLRIIATVAAIEKSCLVDAFQLGAHGVVLRNATPEVFLQSIRSVMAGYYWLDTGSVGMLVEILRESLAQGNGTSSPKDYGLTPREREIIAKIASGRSNREVGQAFSISERTVKHHLTNIFTKIGVSSRLQLALFAVNHRLMPEHVSSVEFEGVQLGRQL
jgi:two-component system nitrate/nitrite response regulator NarL